MFYILVWNDVICLMVFGETFLKSIPVYIQEQSYKIDNLQHHPFIFLVIMFLFCFVLFWFYNF